MIPSLLSLATSLFPRAGRALPQLAGGHGTLPAPEGCAALAQGCGDVPGALIKTGPKSGNTTRGCFSRYCCRPPPHGLLRLPRGAGLGYKPSAWFCMT